MLASVRVPDPDRIMGSYPHQISGGQQQRVVIAMALLSNPKLLLLDEPTTALDVTVEAGIVELIKEIAAEFGTSMIYISHNLGLILETCDRITVMYSGEAVEVGSVDGSVRGDAPSLYARPLRLDPGARRRQEQPPARRHPRPAAAAAPAPARLQFRPALHASSSPGAATRGRSRCCRCRAATSTPRAASASTRSTGMRRSAKAPAAMPTEPGDVVLKVDDLTKHYAIEQGALFFAGETKTVKANEKLNFDAREAETVAIVGESGCGKSTFAKVLMGLETATDGQRRARQPRARPHCRSTSAARTRSPTCR